MGRFHEELDVKTLKTRTLGWRQSAGTAHDCVFRDQWKVKHGMWSSGSW